MRIACFLVAFALLTQSVASAQTSTADGIAAIHEGDYAAAVRILRPLAEDPSVADPLAAFFLATLYHSGKGVALDEIRACGLYLRAAVPANPFASQSRALVLDIHQDHPLARNECVAASLNRWNEPHAATFSLGPDHWARIDSAGFVVGYGGAEKRVATTLGGPGWVYLPTKLTQVEVTRPVSTRRHFIEFLVWMPRREAGEPAWMLLWIPYEIIGIESSLAIRGGVVVTTADQPSTASSVADAIRVRVSAEGEAEWVADGPTPRSGPFPYQGAR